MQHVQVLEHIVSFLLVVSELKFWHYEVHMYGQLTISQNFLLLFQYETARQEYYFQLQCLISINL